MLGQSHISHIFNLIQ